MGRPDAQEPGRTPSAFELVGRNSAAGGWAVLTQVGLVGSTAVLWRVLYKHPAGLFTYHPSFQSLAVLGFLEGILLLQPQPPNATYKRKGLQLHQVVQYTSCAVIVAGAVSIIYNKTLILISLQISFGALIVYTPLQRLLGGQERVKKLWKYHRMTGYLTLYFLILTPLLALASDWVRQNSSSVERWVIGSGLGVAGFGALARVQTSKLGSKTR
ncbi:cytochrome b561 [Rhodotorula toruloides]|uniref:Cytochrome b561 n=1 Tax=Rhodotorula toruloides TaxID=5286 RepID=A0A511KQ43_RHOTO|nr:cytochrome b561 [Rhodotorula toruloides]